ncbi:uncharacterized protein LOC134260858 [Saccostrea cucullata]|uniref:uncharacterized protein LOC134260858 n=1 Tax=Saccostrea cuccullata TaxID=36930 RepID=UPI002ED1B947
MAESNPKYTLGSPQEHIPICEEHGLSIDWICEDCDTFICSTCAKMYHNGHNCVSQTSAASQRRRVLLEYIRDIKEEHLLNIDEIILKKKTENQNSCDSQVKKLQKHFEEIIMTLTEIKKIKEETLKAILRKKNEELGNERYRLDEKKNKITEIVEYLEEYHTAISDKSLIENQGDLAHLLDDIKRDLQNCEFSVTYKEREMDNAKLESIFGHFLYLDDVSVIETNSFQYSSHPILASEALSEDGCYMHVKDKKSDFIELVNKQGKKKQKLSIRLNDFFVTYSGIYFTTIENNSICCISPLGSVSTFLSTNSLIPMGICKSLDDGLFVSLVDSECNSFELDSNSRRLVKHFTLECDLIHEYEFKEDGRTRLFNMPYKLCQNSNSDICVMNITSDKLGEILIISFSGSLRTIYRGQNMKEDFLPADVACDSSCRILVADPLHSRIHLLSPEGEFLKYLLTDKEITKPTAFSLCKSALWIGNDSGLVKVFEYKCLFSY